MIELHTLGDSLIKVGDREIRPTSPLVFAALLYLCVERGRRVPRAALQELLFPEASERSGAHSLRQLLYKLRQLGVPLASTALDVCVRAEDVLVPGVDDIRTTVARLSISSGISILPNVHGRFSPAFTEWLDSFRDATAKSLRQRLEDALSGPSASQHADVVVPVARALLSLDPLSHTATFALAESLALNGRLPEALEHLDQYIAEQVDAQLVASAKGLRKRITGRAANRSLADSPLVGRSADVAWLLGLYADAVNIRSAATAVIWGDAGIGKTRLIAEIQNRLALRKCVLRIANCSSQDSERPLAAIIALLPGLLESPGALGVPPESLAVLQGAVNSPVKRDYRPHVQLTGTPIQRAVADLICSVSAELPVALVFEDAQWLDTHSLELLLSLRIVQAPLLLVLTYRGRPLLPTLVQRTIHLRELHPLGAVDSSHLLTHYLGGVAISYSVAEQCVALTNGNPLFLRTVGDHLRLGGNAPTNDSGLVDLLRERLRLLDPQALLLLRAIALGRPHSCLSRLRVWTGLPVADVLLALQTLADKGLVILNGNHAACMHESLSELVEASLPVALRAALAECIADQLETEGHSTQQPHLLWHSAEHWCRALRSARQAASLTSCADMALQLHQPLLALSALKQAVELSSPTERVALLETLVRAAELAYDSDAVISAVGELLSTRTSLTATTLHEMQLSAVLAHRRRGDPTEHFHQQLLATASARDLPTRLRLRSSRLLLASAEQHLLRDEALHLYNTLHNDEQLHSEVGDWLHLCLCYHVAFGDMTEVPRVARALLAWVRTTMPLETHALTTNAGLALVRSGETVEGISILKNAFASAQASESPTLSLDCAIKLATLCGYLERAEDFRQWHATATALIEKWHIVAPPAHMANELDLVLMQGNEHSAVDLLRRVSEMDECKKPYHRRYAAAYSALIKRRWPEANVTQFSREQLSDLDARGCRMCDHDLFMFAYLFVVESEEGTPAAQYRLQTYLENERRELYAPPSFLRQPLDRSRPVLS